MDRLSLPEDQEACREVIAGASGHVEELVWRLVEEIKRLWALSEKQQHMLDELVKHRYGQKADRFEPDQLMLAIFECLDRAKEKGEEAPTEEVKAHRRKCKGHGRGPLPEHLERRRVEYEPTEEEKRCAGCGTEKVCIGEEVSEQLEYEPASFYVIEHVRKKYACKGCEEGVVIGQKPMQPIEKGLPGPGLLAHVAVSKYADHLPLNRLEGIFQRHGVHRSRKTMCDWMRQCAEVLTPLRDLMKKEVMASKVIHTDDTPVAVQDRNRTKTREGRIWVYVGDRNHPFTVYDYTVGRSRDGPARFLKDFKGYLQADAYGGYDHLYKTGRIKEVACWAHTRRKYVEAQSSDPLRAILAATWIHELYQVEKRASELDAKARASLRQQEARPVLKKFKRWLLGQKPEVLPKSPMGEAISYTLGNWKALNRYVDDGDLAIDNNVAERALRPLTVGRNNWLFFGSDNGGRTGAILYSFVATCKAHHIDPFRYLRDVIGRISAHSSKRLADLLPGRWKPLTDA